MPDTDTTQFKSGDRVQDFGGGGLGTVVAVLNDKTWVRWDDPPGDVVWFTANLRLVEAATTQGAEGLEPCPSCGSPAKHIQQNSLNRVVCTKCGLTTPATMNDYPVRIWNRRTPSPPGGVTKEELIELISPGASKWPNGSLYSQAAAATERVLTRLQSAREREGYDPKVRLGPQIKAFVLKWWREDMDLAEYLHEWSILAVAIKQDTLAYATPSPRSGEEERLRVRHRSWPAGQYAEVLAEHDGYCWVIPPGSCRPLSYRRSKLAALRPATQAEDVGTGG